MGIEPFAYIRNSAWLKSLHHYNWFSYFFLFTGNGRSLGILLCSLSQKLYKLMSGPVLVRIID